LRTTLVEKLSTHLASVKPYIVQLAEEKVDRFQLTDSVSPFQRLLNHDILQGHRVLFSPPHRSDLNPIEMVWGIVKGRLARSFTEDRTLSLLQQALTQELTSLYPSSDLVRRVILQSVKRCTKLYNDEKARELEEAPSEDVSEGSGVAQLQEGEDGDEIAQEIDEYMNRDRWEAHDDSEASSDEEDGFSSESDDSSE
jgi:hypothetical protein